jgi:PAS domain S-box-containing protein
VLPKANDLPDHYGGHVAADPYPADSGAVAAWEERRLAALRKSGILDTGAEQNFDDLTALAAQICETPLALVSFVDADRLWFKSCFGADLHEFPRAHSFCDEAIRQDGIFEVGDLTRDARFAGQVLVTEWGFRFYASALIKSCSGAILGTLSVIDRRPRELSEAQRSALTRLANQCGGQIALKTLLRDQAREIANRTQALRSSEARLSAFMQHAPITMSVKDLSGHYLMVNRASERFYGKSAAEILGNRISDIEKSGGARAIAQLEADMLAAGTSVTREICYERAGGKRWYRDIKFPIPDEGGTTIAIGGIGVEVTATKLAQEELIDAKEHAEAANQAKSQFLANMSHELRTPLNAILGFSEILARNAIGPLGPEKVQAYAGDIHQSGRLLLNIINDILDLSKIEAGRMEMQEAPCNLGDLTNGALNLVANAAQAKSLKLVNAVPPDLPMVQADERALTQILLNLVNNAVKFTLPGGEIRVDAARVNQGEPGDGLALAVSDTGIGIASEDIPLVFSAFGQVQDAFVRGHEGAGLGLPIARALAEAQSGRLDLHSRLGVGTRVTLWLPKTRIIEG